MKLKNEELSKIIGGAVTAAMLSAILNIGKTIFDIGCEVGKNLRQLIFG